MKPTLLIFALSIGISAQGSSQIFHSPKIVPQYVYADQTTKKYYSIECGEVAKIDRANVEGFKSPSAAEKAGYVRGDKCSQSTTTGSSAIKFYGNKSRKEFYDIICQAETTISSEDWIAFTDRADAEKQGYKIAGCPVAPSDPQIPAKVTVVPMKRASVTPMKRAPLPRIVAITSEPGEWLGKLVTVTADVKITAMWHYRDANTYAFRIDDGSAGFYLYMEKKAAQPLRQLILKQLQADGVYGEFTFYLDPEAYELDGELYGRLVSYRVKAD